MNLLVTTPDGEHTQEFKPTTIYEAEDQMFRIASGFTAKLQSGSRVWIWDGDSGQFIEEKVGGRK